MNINDVREGDMVKLKDTPSDMRFTVTGFFEDPVLGKCMTFNPKMNDLGLEWSSLTSIVTDSSDYEDCLADLVNELKMRIRNKNLPTPTETLTMVLSHVGTPETIDLKNFTKVKLCKN